MKNTSYCLTLLLVIIFGLFISSCDQNGAGPSPITTATLRGNITANDEGIPDAVVYLESSNGAQTSKVSNIINGKQIISQAFSKSSQVDYYTETDEQGNYEITDIEPGYYTVYAIKQSHWGNFSSQVLLKADSVTVVNLELMPLGNISGTALLENSENHLGIFCYVAGSSYIAMTNPDGQFLISNVPIGTYTITASKQGYEDSFVDGVTISNAGDTVIVQDTLVLSRLTNYPKVIWTRPANGYIGVQPWNDEYYGEEYPISFQFNKQMDIYTIEDAVTILEDDEEYNDEIRYSWIGGDLLRMYVRIQKNKNYSVIMDTTLKDIDGLTLKEPFDLTFKWTSGIIDHYPEQDGIINPQDSILIIFNDYINLTSLESAISFSPYVSFTVEHYDYYWYGQHAYKIKRTTGSWSSETQYILAIDTTATASVYNIFEPLELVFIGGYFEVINTFPPDGGEVNINSPIYITFNASADSASVINAFSIAPYVNGSFQWMTDRYNNDKLKFIPSIPFTDGAIYTVTIQNSAVCQFGNPMEQEYSFSFTATSSGLAIEYTLYIYDSFCESIDYSGETDVYEVIIDEGYDLDVDIYGNSSLNPGIRIYDECFNLLYDINSSSGSYESIYGEDYGLYGIQWYVEVYGAEGTTGNYDIYVW